MNVLLSIIANLAGMAAEFGAGFMSSGIMYQPEIPEELLKETLDES